MTCRIYNTFKKTRNDEIEFVVMRFESHHRYESNTNTQIG